MADKKGKKDKKKEQSLFWADQLADRVIKQKGDKEIYVSAAGVTPSGTVHIGNFREVITIELVVRALKSKGKEVRFLYSWDDFDVFRKVPKNMPKQDLLHTFLRKPIVDTPDTFGCHKSYAEHNEKEFEKYLPVLGIKPEFLYQAQKYGACEYADEIKHALNHRDIIIKILNKYRKEPLDDKWYPLSVFCEKCRKDTTEITHYDGKYDITYKCNSCEHKDTINFKKKGIVKLPWRVDWPMRWNYENVDFEPGGKEHSTPGGSRTTAVEIFEALYKKKPPLYERYDFIIVKGVGGKMSSSAGNVITLKEALEVYEPEIIRYLFAGSRPGSEFAISFDLDVLKVYEDFDKHERVYFDVDSFENKKKVMQYKRIYEMSAVDIPKRIPFQPSFRHLTNILLMFEGDMDKVVGYYKNNIRTKEDKEKVLKRAERAWNWIQKYAPEDFKFKVNDKVPDITLSDAEKKALKMVAEKVKAKKFRDKELHDEFYNICKEAGVETKDFFKAAYRVLINKERGPQLANFVLTLGDKAVKLFESV